MPRPDPRPHRSLALALAVALGVAASVAARTATATDDLPRATLTLSTGFDFRSGDYDLERSTELWYAPFTVKLRLDDVLALTPTLGDAVELGATLPVLHIEGPFEVVAAGSETVPVDRDDADADPDASEVESDGGIGDVSLFATYLWQPDVRSGLPAFELTGRVKLPTGDEDRGLGIGTTETNVQLDTYRSFGPVTPFVSVGYRFFGDSDDFDLEDGWLVSGGLVGRLSESLSVGAFLDWREAASSSADDPLELTPYLAWRCGLVSVLPYAVVGLSDGSPDYGAGLQLSVAVDLF